MLTGYKKKKLNKTRGVAKVTMHVAVRGYVNSAFVIESKLQYGANVNKCSNNTHPMVQSECTQCL